MAGIRANPIISAADAAAGLVSQISARKVPTRGGSAARHAGAEGYCQCDKTYKIISDYQKSRLNPWWRKISDQPDCTLPAYFCWMKVCLKKLEEKRCFLQYSYCSRYWVWNRDPTTWIDQPVTLLDIPVHSAGGTDLEAFQLLKIKTKKGTVEYDSKMIDFKLDATIPSPGTASVIVPELDPGSSVLVDVYSYDREVA